MGQEVDLKKGEISREKCDVRGFEPIKIIILGLSVVQQTMRVTRRIVLTLLTKALYEFGCFKEKVWSFLKFWIWQRCYFTELP